MVPARCQDEKILRWNTQESAASEKAPTFWVSAASLVVLDLLAKAWASLQHKDNKQIEDTSQGKQALGIATNNTRCQIHNTHREATAARRFLL